MGQRASSLCVGSILKIPKGINKATSSMAEKTSKAQKRPEKKMVTPEEAQALIIQHQKEATLPSLLYVTRKLGEVEGMISMQAGPDENLVNVQKDFTRLYDKLVEKTGVEQSPEGEGEGIGGDRF